MILGNYIGGRWVAPRDGATLTKCNPADVRDIIGDFPSSNAIGPVIDLNEGELQPRLIQITIGRAGTMDFGGEISTSQMRRRPDDLANWLFREFQFPSGVFLFTGTGIVPPNDFTLQESDIVRITIEGIGTLENTVANNP